MRPGSPWTSSRWTSWSPSMRRRACSRRRRERPGRTNLWSPPDRGLRRRDAVCRTCCARRRARRCAGTASLGRARSRRRPARGGARGRARRRTAADRPGPVPLLAGRRRRPAAATRSTPGPTANAAATTTTRHPPSCDAGRPACIARAPEGARGGVRTRTLPKEPRGFKACAIHPAGTSWCRLVALSRQDPTGSCRRLASRTNACHPVREQSVSIGLRETNRRVASTATCETSRRRARPARDSPALTAAGSNEVEGLPRRRRQRLHPRFERQGSCASTTSRASASCLAARVASPVENASATSAMTTTGRLNSSSVAVRRRRALCTSYAPSSTFPRRASSSPSTASRTERPNCAIAASRCLADQRTTLGTPRRPTGRLPGHRCGSSRAARRSAPLGAELADLPQQPGASLAVAAAPGHNQLDRCPSKARDHECDRHVVGKGRTGKTLGKARGPRPRIGLKAGCRDRGGYVFTNLDDFGRQVAHLLEVDIEDEISPYDELFGEWGLDSLQLEQRDRDIVM